MNHVLKEANPGQAAVITVASTARDVVKVAPVRSYTQNRTNSSEDPHPLPVVL